MQPWTVLSENSFPSSSWAHVAVLITVAWRFLMQRCLRAPRSPNSGFCPWLFHIEISLDSLNLFTIFSSLDALDLTLTNIFSTYWWFSDRIWHKVVSPDPSVFGKSKPLLDAPFITNPDTLTCYQKICWLENLPELCYFYIPLTFSIFHYISAYYFWLCCCIKCYI